jgi:tetratricopeptide (TPR) repeat protein/catechol 2,3-dioxygenase-like lactoylglutathione lyase family enzyme
MRCPPWREPTSLVDYYGSQGKLVGIDATGPVEDVTVRAIDVLRSQLPALDVPDLAAATVHSVDTPPEPPPRLYDDSTSWQRATELHWRGQLQEAEQAYRDIVEARARALGWDHPDTLTARDQHATVLRDLDRLAEALVECDEALAARVRILGEDHPDALTSRSHLATIYHQLGDLSRSETEHQRVLEARTRVLGANHQETLISRSNLAKVYQDMGELDRAIDDHNAVMQARARLLGAEHRDTLMSRSLLASALHHAGRLVEAEAEHRSVLGSRLRLLGPVHLDTAVSRHRLASVLHDLGRLDEAINEYRGAQSVYAQLLGPSSPFARAAANDLTLAEQAAGSGTGRQSQTNTAMIDVPPRTFPPYPPDESAMNLADVGASRALPDDDPVVQLLATPSDLRTMPPDSINGISVTLIVSDIERSRRFYRDTVGLIELDSSRSSAVLACGDARIVLRQVADMPPIDRRVVHLNLEVPDVSEAYERLRNRGVEFVHRPGVTPQGDQMELHCATFRDPDGHAIALTRWELRRHHGAHGQPE